MTYSKPLPITSWAVEDRPREKLIQRGISSLTDAELLAIIIGNGTQGASAIDLGREIIRKFGGLKEVSRATVQELAHVRGIGRAKAIAINAAFELCKRKKMEENQVLKVTGSKTVADYLKPRMSELQQEIFFVLFLNRNNEIVGEKIISTGGLSSTIIDPRLVYKEALSYLASSIIVCHNHPSGNPQPSALDISATQKLKAGGDVLDIQLMDHIIIAGNTYYSFLDEGIL